MLKSLVVVAAFLAVGVSSEPNNPSGKDQHKAEGGPPSTVTIVDNSSRQEATNAPAKEPPEPHAGIEWSNWVVAGVALLTCWAVWKQARESGKATQAMRESVQVQAAGLKQWIDVQVMGSDWERVPPIGALIGKISIRFNAANQTAYPLAIKGILVMVSGNRVGEPKWLESKRKDDVTLSPGIRREGVVVGQSDTSQYQFLVTVELDTPMVEAYRGCNLTLSISGQVSFKPVVGPIEPQVFGEMVVCGPNRLKVLPLWAELVSEENGNG